MAFSFSHFIRTPGGREYHSLSLELKRGRVSLDRQAAFDALEQEQRRAMDAGMTHKIWVTESDGQTRSGHRLADGQRRPINEPFFVGG